MRGTSRASMATARERLEALLSSGDTESVGETLGDELFAVLHLLDREHGLRRALSDPAQPADRKAGTARGLLQGKLSEQALGLVEELVRLRWARSVDLADAIDELAVTCAVARAEAAGKLDELEDELFRFGRILAARPELRRALGDRVAPAQAKADLVENLLRGKVTAPALRLVSEVATHPRGRTLDQGLAAYGRIAAERRSGLVAVVRTSVELTEQQKTRLAAALSARYDRDVHLNVEVDPAVLGGLSVLVGDEEIDGSIARRLSDIQRRLGGLG
jgi:F-type H+-transporting ATPase subunit delta